MEIFKSEFNVCLFLACVRKVIAILCFMSRSVCKLLEFSVDVCCDIIQS